MAAGRHTVVSALFTSFIPWDAATTVACLEAHSRLGNASLDTTQGRKALKCSSFLSLCQKMPAMGCTPLFGYHLLKHARLLQQNIT